MNTRKVGTLLLTGMIVGISLTSCKKDEVDPEQTTSEKLVGNWESSYEEDGYTYTTNLDLKGIKISALAMAIVMLTFVILMKA